MGLNDIILAPYLVKHLYENTLIEEVANSNPIGNTKKAKDENFNEVQGYNINKIENFSTIKYLGKNDKNILLIISEKEHAFLGEEDLGFLINILNACKISMQDVALINSYENQTITYDNLNEQFEPHQIIFFGTAPHQLGFPIQIPLYKIQQYANQQYLCAESLQQLATDKEEKKKLWVQLKTLFEV